MGLIFAVLLSVIAMESVSCYLCLARSCSLTEQLQEHSHTPSLIIALLLYLKMVIIIIFLKSITNPSSGLHLRILLFAAMMHDYAVDERKGPVKTLSSFPC